MTKDEIIEYYEDKLEEATHIFWRLSDNPYRKGLEMTEQEIENMKKFLDEFEYQEGGTMA